MMKRYLSLVALFTFAGLCLVGLFAPFSSVQAEDSPMDFFRGKYGVYKYESKAVVSHHYKEKPGTIIIETDNKELYYLIDENKAWRYSVAVGRGEFAWFGVEKVSSKKRWPDWRPPASMLKRNPSLPIYVKGGKSNPMGSRALYLGSTLYRIHGTNEPWKIGQAVSSGCIRMKNSDIDHLYEMARVGAKVIVKR